VIGRIGLIELGIGLIELGIGLIELGIGLVELGIGLIELGKGLMELGIITPGAPSWPVYPALFFVFHNLFIVYIFFLVQHMECRKVENAIHCFSLYHLFLNVASNAIRKWSKQMIGRGLG